MFYFTTAINNLKKFITTFITVVFITLLSAPVFADVNEGAGKYNLAPSQMENQKLYKKATAMMGTGIGLSVLAMSGTIFAGVVIIGSSVSSANEDTENATNGPIAAYALGLPVLGGSLILAAVGIPLWVIGSKRRKAIKKTGFDRSPSLSFVPLQSKKQIIGGSLTATWKF